MKVKKIVLYTPLIEWYQQRGLRLIAVHQLIEYKPDKPFSQFPEEVAKARREADKDRLKKQQGNVAKLKGNSFYGKMIEGLDHHKMDTDDTKLIICTEEQIQKLSIYFELKRYLNLKNISYPLNIDCFL